MKKIRLFVLIAIMSFLLGMLVSGNLYLKSEEPSSKQAHPEKDKDDDEDALDVPEDVKSICDKWVKNLQYQGKDEHDTNVKIVPTASDIVESYNYFIDELVKIVDKEKGDNKSSVIRRGEVLRVLKEIGQPKLLPFFIKHYKTPQPTGEKSKLKETVEYPAREYVDNLIFQYQGTASETYLIGIILDYLKKQPPENISKENLVHYKKALQKLMGNLAKETIEQNIENDPSLVNLKRIWEIWDK